MRKNRLMLIIILLLFLVGITNIKAFPDSLTSIYQQGSTVYGSKGSYRAALKRSNNGYISICTKYNGSTPAAGRKTCNLNSNWSLATRAGVAYIINTAGINNGITKATSSYVDAELAISEFLYIIGDGGDDISDKRVQYDWVNGAVSTRNTVQSNINNISISIGSVSSSQDANNYYLSIPINTSYAYSLTVKKGNTTYNKSGNSYVIPKSTLSEGNNSITISAIATYAWYQARQYTCGGSYQPLTPNSVEWTTLNTSSATKTVNLVKESKGNIQIKIYDDDTNQLIQNPNRQGTYQLFKNSNCVKGNEVGGAVGTSSGAKLIESLNAGTYSIGEITAPNDYIPSTDTCVKKNITVTSGSTSPANIYYKQGCKVKLDSSDKSVPSLINLYKEFELRGLLNFNNPSCSDVKCEYNSLENFSCLSGNNNLISTFNEANLSCYDDIVQSDNGSIGFCIDSFSITNNLNNISKFYSKSGQFLIKKEQDDRGDYYQIFDNNYDSIKIYNDYIAKTTNTRTCYIYNKETYNGYNDLNTSSLFFGDNDNDSLPDELNSNTNVMINYNANINDYFKKYVYQTQNNYSLNEVYLEKITGKYTNDGENPTYGLISNFNTPSGVIPYMILYNSKPLSLNSCTYETTPEIIKYNQSSNGKIDLEFRTIDKKTPFDRQTKTNWCSNDPSDPCNKENSTVNSVIHGRNDSYNRTQAGAIYSNVNTTNRNEYKIVLTPENIKEIREHNKTVGSYDDYSVYCDEKGKCSTPLLDKLGIKKVN